jgi:hypothetical protein
MKIFQIFRSGFRCATFGPDGSLAFDATPGIFSTPGARSSSYRKNNLKSDRSLKYSGFPVAAHVEKFAIGLYQYLGPDLRGI